VNKLVLEDRFLSHDCSAIIRCF